MAVGDITSTFEGIFDLDSAALLTELDTLSTGGATSSADTTDIRILAIANTNQVAVFTLARSAV